ncbi:conserved hypothetical protein [Theileria orientalis strain Shintoku]|uniref:Uncharacterized protein n=1 Tax=Theileria orientalis strain Shintoku TaxID=869250 RepID=J7MF22_THEOR|nr:conserved hypothetical protein [Theileria orientalis strain Shintoku]BAM42379.1 conserved hypothetical protein [Theileria orientalis strain Shintoku]|eukprot:XP_009692680.1 conserved hypothetical protein [Theileria orientalis strain Shintoku]
MTTICLTNYSSSYFAGNVTITVKCEGYKCSNLFQRYEHKLKKPTGGKIYLYNGSSYFTSYLYSYATLQPENGYKSSELEKVYIYVNRFDSNKSFLLWAFYFKNGSPPVQNRYYPYSDLNPARSTTMNITGLNTFKEESDILCALLQENDSLPGLLTYDIMKRPAPNNGNGGTNCKYNCNKISVTNDTSTNANGNGEPKVGAGFTRYKHTPTTLNNGNNNNGDKPACMIYRCQTLMGGNGTQAQTQELPEIQGQKYTCVSVYFGCKAKRNGAGASTAGKSAGACPAPTTSGSEGAACKPGSSTCSPATGEGTCPPAPTEPTSPCNQDVPLLLELHRNGTNGASGDNNPQYYAHFRSTNGAQKNGNGPDKYYWVQLPCGNGADGRTNGDCVLKNLLEDIGLHTKKQNGASHNGHETLKQLLKQALKNGVTEAHNADLSTELQKMTGQNLTKLLGQPVNGSPGENGRQNGQNTLITLLLKRIEFNVTDSVVVLLDKKCKNGGHNGGQDGSYGDPEISTAVSNLEPNGRGTRVNRLKLNGAGGGTKITVTDVTTSNGDPNPVCQCLAKCLKKYGYCVIQHDFSQAVNTKLGQGCSAGLRLLIPARDNGRGNGGVGTNGQNNTKYRELKLYPSDKQTDPAHLQYLYYTKGAGSEGSAACTTACTTSTTGHTCSKTQNAQICSRLYVVFYKSVGGTSTGGNTGDPRPLLLGYGGCWYRPKDKNGYFDTWVQIQGVEKTGACECSDGGAGANCQKHEKLLCELTKVVGFLNTVDLFQHPNSGGEAGQTQCQPGQQGAGTPTQCQAAPTSGQTTCQSETSGTAKTCTYEVHKFDGKPIRVQVTCQDVPTTQPPTASSGCYKKLTHKPAGLGNGSGDASSASNGATGFRLGDVVYRGNGCTGGKPQGTIKYYGNGDPNALAAQNNKWSPLLQVTVYYYKHDTGHCDPLLVELEFAKVAANGLQNGANDNKEYYYLKERNGSGGKLVWEKDSGASEKVKPGCLTRYLDGIRYCLKKVVRIRLECKGTNGGQGYALEGRNAKNGQGQFSPIKNGVPPTNGKIDVKVCECQCPALTARKYKCLKHGLTEALKSVHYQVAGLVFTLPGRNGDTSAGGKAVEIPLYSAAGSEEQGLGSSCSTVPGQPSVPAAPETCPPASKLVKPGQPITTLYNSCMGDVYVYFYASGGGTSGSDTDTVPLMLRYNGFFYKPESRDCYFDRWVCVDALAATKGWCCCPGQDTAQETDCTGDCQTLADQLDSVNECLNRVDLDKSSKTNGSVAGQGYGLPESNGGNGGHKLADSVGNVRVCLTKQTPAGTDAKKAYVKVVHRTKNGFRIGCLTYCGKEITQDGVTPTALSNGQCNGPGSPGVGATCNGGSAADAGATGNGAIRVAKGTGGPNGNGNHKNLVTTCGWNTVVVYYSTSDKCYSLPQLIVLLRTDSKVEGQQTVTTKTGKYGYYLLYNGGRGPGHRLEYKWVEVGGDDKSGVTLDDATDFSLLNSAVILLERTVGKSGGKYNDEQINQAVESAIQNKSLKESPGYTGQVNRLTGKDITVKDETETGGATHKCLEGTGFKVMTHDLTPFVKLNGPFKDKLNGVTLITGLKFVIPDSGETGSYKSVKLCPNGDDTSCSNEERHYYINGNNKIRVFFYGSDPRPLILCYGSNVYTPKDKNGYNLQQWQRLQEVTKCVCNGQVTSGDSNEKLLKALVTTVGFLNTVELQLYPGMSNGAKSTCENGQQSPGTATECKNGANNTCKYAVHKFDGKKILVHMTCEPVSSTGSSCYSRLTHVPLGTENGAGNGNGFRLGNIVHTADKCKLDYYNTGNNVSDENKWKPLVEVIVYYYNEDTTYCDPLLVVLEFKPNGADSTNAKEYYKLKTRNTDSMEWEKDQEAKCVVDNSEELVKHLDSIRLCLKQVVRIRLEYNGTNSNNKYALMGRSGKDSTKNGFNTPINGTAPGSEVKVDVCECPGCQPLSGRNYKCLKHKLVDALDNKQHQVAGLVFTLPGTNGVGGAGDKPIVIPLIGAKGQKNAQTSCSASPPAAGPPGGTTCSPGAKPEPEKSTTLLYNKCMGDICVYFYASGGGTSGSETDTVPLMLHFNGQFYKPETRDCYFDRWVCVDALAATKGWCCCPGQDAVHGADCQKLADELDSVNEALNRIDLDPEKAKKASSGTGYGLPDNNGGGSIKGYKLSESVGNERVTLKEQKGPSADPAYKRIIHRTKNGFWIGQLMYNQKEIVTQGITPNGTAGAQNGSETKIPVSSGTTKDNGNHTKLVSANKWNTVVAYYSCTDNDLKLPQLIVILKTDKKVQNGDDTVTGSGKYGYYVISSAGTAGTEYEYKWRLVENGELTQSGVKLDDKTDFSLLNSAVILLERTVGKSGGKYNDEQINQAVTKAGLTSPGNKKGQINRLNGRDITVEDETKTGTHQCLKDTGFKAMSHDITKLIELDGNLKDNLSNVTLITGIKLLIPTALGCGEYKRVTLKDNNTGGVVLSNGYTDASIKYHQKGQDKVCVFFYSCDPRPLLVCYNGWAYAPKDKKCYFDEWVKAKEVTECKCTDSPSDNCKILVALVKVADFLNPVRLQITPQSGEVRRLSTGKSRYYYVHSFDGQGIRIGIEAQKADESFCYNGYTHTHSGVGCGGQGFRLGDIWHGKKCIKENGSTTKSSNGNGTCISASDVNDSKNHKASPEVVVFYYKGDKNHEHPLLVALRNPAWCFYYNTYFELTKKFDPGQQKKYTKNKNGNGIDLGNTSPDGELAKKLDSILFKISKKLQIVLSTRPVPTEYKPGQNGLITDVFDTGTGDKSSNQKAAKQLFDVKTRILKEVADELEKTSKTTATNALTTGKPLATRDALLHHVTLKASYQAKLCDNKGQPSAPPEPNATEIPVEEVNCPGLKPGGYRCFKHDLVSANHIESVGGLVLRVFAKHTGGGPGTQSANGKCQPCPKQGEGQGNEGLELCTGQTTSDGETGCKNGKNGCKNGKNGQSVQLSYTTCKGNLYVFFYGEDPRPLMLCYNDHAYRPVCMDEYCKQWVRVGNGAQKAVSCFCSDQGQQTGRKGEPKFNTPALLPELYRVSVLLNPVYLCLTQRAISTLKPKRPDQQPGSADGSSSASGPQAAADDYTYLTHNYPPDPVRVRVTTQDLQCYRRYTHKPEHEGFRLGRVTYAQPPCPEGAGAGQGTGAVNGPSCPSSPAATTAPTTTTTTTQAFCFKYAPEKQLQTVCTYYYMYDCAHYWPLVVELGFKGRPSEWWRLCSGPQEGGGNVANTGGSGNGGGGSTAASTGNGSPTTSSDSSGPAPSKPPTTGLKWVPMTARPGQTGTGAGQTGTGAGHTNTGTGTGTGDSCSDAQSPQNGAAKPAATQPGANGDCPECPPPGAAATGTGGAQPGHNGNGHTTTQNNNGNHAQNGNGNNGTAHTTDQTSQEQREKREQTCARDAAFARDAREIENKLGKTVLGIPAYPRNYPGLEIDLRELIERRAYEIRKSLGIEYGSKDKGRLIMETDSNCQEESIMAYLVGGGVFGAAGGSGWKLVTMVTGMTRIAILEAKICDWAAISTNCQHKSLDLQTL